METYYTIYKVTNKINGKIYIGSHKTKDLNDDYMGSGKYLTYAIKKHGVENFNKEILFVFDNPESMYFKEAEIVDVEFIAEANTYNLKVGGFGGWDYVNTNMMASEDRIKFSRKGGQTRHITRNELGKRISKGISQSDKKLNATIKVKELYPYGTFYGKTHTDESKQAISNANKGKRSGTKNSQYGTCWIHDTVTTKKVKLKDLSSWVNNGWIRGRIQNTNTPSSK